MRRPKRNGESGRDTFRAVILPKSTSGTSKRNVSTGHRVI